MIKSTMNNHQFSFAIELFLAIGIIAINSRVVPNSEAVNLWICNDDETNRKMTIDFDGTGITYLKNEELEDVYNYMQRDYYNSTTAVSYNHCSNVADVERNPIIWECTNTASKQKLMGYSKYDIQKLRQEAEENGTPIPSFGELEDFSC